MHAPAPERSPGAVRVGLELLDELTHRRRLPPGELTFSLLRTHRFQRDTLRMLLEYYERFGPVFTFRSLHRPIVAMIGPEANHFVTVSGAGNFSWRKGMFGEQLLPLLGDGLITTDDDYHDSSRRIMMPAFHRRRMDAAVEVITREADRAIGTLTPGPAFDFYEWARDLAMAIAMRALMGLDPEVVGHDAANHFEGALSYYDTESVMMLLRGPRTPWARMQSHRQELDRIIFGEIESRRTQDLSDRDDVLSMLIEARDEADQGFTAQELRDQVMHLLFGGHDTTSSTLSFLFYELARNRSVRERVLDELDTVLEDGRSPTTEDLLERLPYLSMVLDETLRLYPPVWFGPRLTTNAFTFAGHEIPAGVHVIHCSWASHRLPEVFPDPEAFIPERFAPENRKSLAPGAYIPFGAGQRVCIGKRFGQLVVKAVAVRVLQRQAVELAPGFELRIAKVPTLSPEGGLRVTSHLRQRAAQRDTVST
ncbi:MAG: cytochrome P450 [Solirubrobacteraceae bacterium]